MWVQLPKLQVNWGNCDDACLSKELKNEPENLKAKHSPLGFEHLVQLLYSVRCMQTDEQNLLKWTSANMIE